MRADSIDLGRSGRLAIAVCALLALALRLPGIFQEPWIDEVWSWGSARSTATAWDALTSRGSNNHPLNTLWIRVLGDQRAFWPYRLLSITAGVALVLVSARVAARSGRASAVLAAFVAAVSYPLVVYSTEARGYALQVAATLAALEAAWTWIDRRGRAPLLAFWLVSIAGFLAQYLFAVGWVAVAAGATVRLYSEQPRRPARTRDLALLLGPPLLGMALWWLLVARGVVNQGAPDWSVLDVVRQTLAWSSGLPEGWWLLAVPLSLFVLVADARALQKRGDAAWVVQLLGVVVLPLSSAFALSGEYVAPRYFLAALALWLLSLARVLAGLAERSRSGARFAVAVTLLFTLGNSLRTAQFLRVGRGAPSAIVLEMARRSGDPHIRVAGNYDFNVGGMLAWFGRALPPGRTLEYVSGKRIPPEGVPFLIVDRPRFEGEPEERLVIGAITFERIAISRRFGPCGSDWALYARR